MTDDMMNLQELAAKAPDVDMLREMISFAAQRLMEMEVGAITGAAHGEKSGERLVQRNGCEIARNSDPLRGGFRAGS